MYENRLLSVYLKNIISDFFIFLKVFYKFCQILHIFFKLKTFFKTTVKQTFNLIYLYIIQRYRFYHTNLPSQICNSIDIIFVSYIFNYINKNKSGNTIFLILM